MKVLLDANVLIAVVNKEAEHYYESALLLTAAESLKGYRFFVSTISLAIVFYFMQKKVGAKVAKQRLGMLADHLEILPVGKADHLDAMSNPRIYDYEDGLQYGAAVRAGCNCIITLDYEDFYFSKLKIYTPASFLSQRF